MSSHAHTFAKKDETFCRELVKVSCNDDGYILEVPKDMKWSRIEPRSDRGNYELVVKITEEK